MTGDPSMVVVTEKLCNACGTPRVDVHHQSFPEMRISGESPNQAADGLLVRLETDLTAVSDPLHCEPVQVAIVDVQAFINRDTARQSKLSEAVDVRPASDSQPGAAPSLLVKGETVEVRRLTLPKGRNIPTHHAAGEITVHCLEGRIAFTASGETRDVGAGQLIILAAGEPHSLVSLEDSTVLVTKVLPVRPSEDRGGSVAETSRKPQ